jgi:hypothetical protein
MTRICSKKECKYFNKGEGTCPFGNKCFYRHALADGTIKDVGPPRRRRKFGADGEQHDHLEVSEACVLFLAQLFLDGEQHDHLKVSDACAFF